MIVTMSYNMLYVQKLALTVVKLTIDVWLLIAKKGQVAQQGEG